MIESKIASVAILGLLIALSVPVLAMAQEPSPPVQDLQNIFPKKPPYSPYADRHFPERVYWGDTHLHTAISLDAGAAGCRLGPRDAYRFAKGEQILSSSGQPVKLSRPLDFLVVTDHSDNMGFITDLFAGKPELLADPTGRRWYDMIQSGNGGQAALEIIGSFSQGKFPEARVYAPGTQGYRSTWETILKAAEEANAPGRFTAFIGLRMDLALQWQQPAPQRHFPRRCNEGQPGRTLHHDPSLWEQQSSRAVEVDGRLRTEDRWRGPSHRPQWQSLERHYVSRHRIIHGEADRPRVR